MNQLNFETESIIALSILAWMIGLFAFDTLRRRRQKRREAWNRDSERRWT